MANVTTSNQQLCPANGRTWKARGLCLKTITPLFVLSVVSIIKSQHATQTVWEVMENSMADMSIRLTASPARSGGFERGDAVGRVNGRDAESPQCTAEQLSLIQGQLPPEDCYKYAATPYYQQCSFTYASRCPDAVWLRDHYLDRHRRRDESSRASFAAMFIGCNKGMDAVDAMRMGSGDPFFDKLRWKDAMTKGGRIKLHQDVCNQASTEQFPLPSQNSTNAANATDATSSKQLFVPANVFCVEPSPATARELSRSASELGYDRRGFLVSPVAVAKSEGTVPFPNLNQAGKENKGMSSCYLRNGKYATRDGIPCIDVPMHTLDNYVTKYFNSDDPIDYLSIDVEGFDFDVLLGGKQKTLPRVHYLEFEYNWMGSWSNQTLLSAIKLLDEQYGFTCYWPGFDNNIWRITGCWLRHYKVRAWSNVACVNRNVEEVKPMADHMERLFLQTIAKGTDIVMNYTNRFPTSWQQEGSHTLA